MEIMKKSNAVLSRSEMIKNLLRSINSILDKELYARLDSKDYKKTCDYVSELLSTKKVDYKIDNFNVYDLSFNSYVLFGEIEYLSKSLYEIKIKNYVNRFFNDIEYMKSFSRDENKIDEFNENDVDNFVDFLCELICCKYLISTDFEFITLDEKKFRRRKIPENKITVMEDYLDKKISENEQKICDLVNCSSDYIESENEVIYEKNVNLVDYEVSDEKTLLDYLILKGYINSAEELNLYKKEYTIALNDDCKFVETLKPMEEEFSLYYNPSDYEETKSLFDLGVTIAFIGKRKDLDKNSKLKIMDDLKKKHFETCKLRLLLKGDSYYGVCEKIRVKK